MKTEHSKEPWHVGGLIVRQQSKRVSYIGIGNGGEHIARAVITGCINEQTARANAAFIVRACNAHDGLVAALSAAVEALSEVPCLSNKQESASVQARFAIAKATQP